MFAVGDFQGSVRVWDYEEEVLLTEFSEHRAHYNYIWGMAFSPDASLLVAGGAQARIRFYDVTNGRACPTQLEHSTRSPTPSIARICSE